MKSEFSVRANLVDVINRSILPAQIDVKNGKIVNITRLKSLQKFFALPGFIDAHVHVESSMLVPSEFAKLATKHGTVATISDPHEIANVMGMQGVEYMINNGKKVPFHFFFGAPSCVPATSFETAGAKITSKDIEVLLKKKEVVYLAEMMNYPGVLHKDKEVMAKLAIAKKLNKPVDGHAPGLMGADMKKYFDAGITTDHECFKYDEALAKIKHGVKIMIREGSAAKNFDTLIPLIEKYPEQIMFCCDDKHPDSLIESHIDMHVKRALKLGYDLFDVLRASSYNVIKHYNLPVGMLQLNDSADFIIVKDLVDFKVKHTYIKGELVYKNGKSYIKSVPTKIINQFNCKLKQPKDFEIKGTNGKVRVIEALEGQLITKEIISKVELVDDNLQVDIKKDILKIAVINRYKNAPVSVAFIKNFGLKKGAIASCVAHDCHNIIVVGTNDEDMCAAANFIIVANGGISLSNGKRKQIIALPIGGIMTNEHPVKLAKRYIKIDKAAKELGSKLKAPYMTLSFMALLVIPELKLSDKGLFDGREFKFVDVEV